MNSKEREGEICARTVKMNPREEMTHTELEDLAVGAQFLAQVLTSLCHIGHHKFPPSFVRTVDDEGINSDNDPVHGSEKSDAS